MQKGTHIYFIFHVCMHCVLYTIFYLFCGGVHFCNKFVPRQSWFRCNLFSASVARRKPTFIVITQENIKFCHIHFVISCIVFLREKVWWQTHWISWLLWYILWLKEFERILKKWSKLTNYLTKMNDLYNWCNKAEINTRVFLKEYV